MSCDAALGVILRDCHVLMIRRKADLRDPFYWNVSFPGGSVERSDRDCLDTAIREVMEEVGIKLRRDSLLGELPRISPLSARINVKPFLFVVNGDVPIRIGSEVESAKWLDLRELREKYSFIPAKGIIVRSLYCCDYVIWGMSYRLLKIILHTMQVDAKDNSCRIYRLAQN